MFQWQEYDQLFAWNQVRVGTTAVWGVLKFEAYGTPSVLPIPIATCSLPSRLQFSVGGVGKVRMRVCKTALPSIVMT